MFRMSSSRVLVLACSLLLAGGASAAPIQLTATDPTSDITGGIFGTFDLSSGPLAGHASFVTPAAPVLDGATLQLEIQLDPSSSGTRFTGLGGPGPDLVILDSLGGTLLEATVNEIFVTNYTWDGGFNITSITLGGFQPGNSDFDVTYDPFDIIEGPQGEISLLLNNLQLQSGGAYSPSLFSTATVFDADFTSQTNITMVFNEEAVVSSPEPSSALLLGGALAGLAAARRRRRRGEL